jgi:hypothetical protein
MMRKIYINPYFVSLIKKIGLFLIFLITCYLLYNILKGKPSINFYQTKVDMGLIKLNDAKLGEFIFSNEGKGKLIIYDVIADCGCTDVEWSPVPVKYLGTGKISYVFYPNKTGGKFTKNISVFCNCQPKKYKLQIFGEVIP